MSTPSVLPMAVAVAGVAVVGAIDYVTGYEIRLYPLYYLPVAAVAWYGSRRGALVLCVLSATAWALSNWLAGSVYSHPAIWAVNATVQFVGFAVVGSLVAELRQRLTREESLSRHDPLTGLLNRRAFVERAELVFQLAARHEKPVTMAFIDLDHFKQVNDEHGHEEGDHALLSVAKELEGTLRASDVLARLGGDEFVVVLYDADATVARHALDRARAAVADVMGLKGWPITLSIGAKTYHPPLPAVAGALEDADALMYRVKRAGRDQVVIA